MANIAKTPDIIRKLCKKENISATDLEVELGFGNGSLTKKKTAMRSDRLLIVADYFNVSMEYLMGVPEKNISSVFDEMIKNEVFMDNIKVLFKLPSSFQAEIYNQIRYKYNDYIDEEKKKEAYLNA